MASIPTSPTSPTSRRRSVRLSSFEILDSTSPSPYMSGMTNGTLFSRRSSRTSQTSFPQSPVTPRPTSIRSSQPSSLYHRRKSSSRLSIGSNISIDVAENGLGNLADELEDALEDEYEINGSGFLDGIRDGSVGLLGSPPQSPFSENGHSEANYSPYPRSPISMQDMLRPPPQASPTRSKSEKRRNKHRRIESESDDEEDGFTPALAKRLRDVESLVRTSVNAEDTLSEGGGVIRRTTYALKDLGPQANIETHVSRVISAYTSMATHRTHKTRDLFNQSHSLSYANTLALPAADIEQLLSDLETLSSTITLSQQQNPLVSLQMLATQTLDLAHTLRSLTDTLQESRIQANTATRKLKSARDMVEDIRAEQELVETSILLIQAGDWDRRCRERQAAATCREVVLGFGDRWGLEVDDRPWTKA